MNHTRRRLLASIPILFGNSIGFAEEQPSLMALQGVWNPQPASNSLAPLGVLYQVALPLITAAGAPASILFYGITGTLRVGPASAFSYGISAIEYEVRIAGAAGQSYREEWSRDGVRQPQLDTQSNIPSDSALFVNRIQLNTGGAVPRGDYRLRVLVAELIGADVHVNVA